MLSRNFFKRFSLLTLFFLLPTINLHLLGLRKNYLYQYINVNSQFSFLNAFWLIIFIIVFAYLSASIGRLLFHKINLDLPPSFQTAIGLIFINIYLFPFFFLNLFKLPIIIFIFAPLLILAAQNPPLLILANFNLKPPIKLSSKKLYYISLFLFLTSISLHFVDSLLPFDFLESSGDIANNYLRISMAFAQAGGVYNSKLLASSVAGLVNYEALSSILIVFTNPQIIKVFGFFIFFLTFLLLYDFLNKILKLKFSFPLSTILVISPFFIDKLKFSFAHPRVYLMFLCLLTLCLIYLGYRKKKPQYHCLSLVSLGILATTNYQGLLAAIIAFFYLIPSLIQWLKKSPKMFVFSVLIFFTLASAFPFWIYYNQGSPFPNISFFNQLLHFKPNPEMSSSWVNERVLLQTSLATNNKLNNLAIAILNMSYYGLGPLILLFFLSPFFIKNKTIKFFLSFYFIYTVIIFPLFSSAALSTTVSRFQIITLPILLIFTSKSLDLTGNKIKKLLPQINKKLGRILKKLVTSNFFQFFWEKRHFFITAVLKFLFIFLLIYLFGHLISLRNLMLNYWLIFSLITAFIFNSLVILLIKSIKEKLSIKKIIFLNLLFVFFISFIIIKFHLLFAVFPSLSSLTNGLKRRQLLLFWLNFVVLDYFGVFRGLNAKRLRLQSKSPIQLSSQQLKLALSLIVYLSLIILFINSFKILSSQNLFTKKVLFLSKETNLTQYFNWRDVVITEYLNKNFTENTKIIYFFHTFGIYSKPQLYQPTNTPLLSYLYQPDINLALQKFKQEEMSYLIIDNRWKISAINPYLSMIADISTPLFSPQFFSQHFTLIPNGIPGFYLFQINYKGLKGEELEENLQAILKEGFFCLIYSSLVNKQDHAIKLKANSYSHQQLLSSYQDLDIDFCPATIRKCFYYQKNRPQDCFEI